MMKRVLFITMMVVLVGCGERKPIPSVRLHQTAGAFSFVTPDGWFRDKLAGIDFMVVSTVVDFGMKPNIYVDFVDPETNLDDMSDRIIALNKRNHPSYGVVRSADFPTEFGLAGAKITAGRENKEALPLALFHYLFQDGERVIVITCTCADPVKQAYEPVFDATMMSLQGTRVGQ